MTKIVIVTPVWQRSQVFKQMMNQMDIFHAQAPEDIELINVYIFSPEDEELEQMKAIFRGASHRRHALMFTNDAIGHKINLGVDFAAYFDYDYIMNFGSDDLIHPYIFNLYKDSINGRIPVFGLNNVYFYNPGEDPVLFSYYNTPSVVGAGRMIHRDVIDTVIREDGELYQGDLKRGMDTFSANRIAKHKYPTVTIHAGEFPYLVDVKSDVNINSFEQITCSHTNSEIKRMPIELLTSNFTTL
jgi:hypothetical protein